MGEIYLARLKIVLIVLKIGSISTIDSRLKIKSTPNGVHNLNDAHDVANNIGYPVLVRPSYVLGGAAMKIVYSDDALDDYISNSLKGYDDRALLIDKFLDDAIEIDVDAISDGTDCVVAGIMQHIEEAGIHSGDSVQFCQNFANRVNGISLESHEKIANKLSVIGY